MGAAQKGGHEVVKGNDCKRCCGFHIRRSYQSQWPRQAKFSPFISQARAGKRRR
jgi:hypothetical protein